MAFRAHRRSIEERDEVDEEEEYGFDDSAAGCGAGGAPVRADDWKRVVHGWINQAIRLKDRGELAGSILDVSGRHDSAGLLGTLAAHTVMTSPSTAACSIYSASIEKVAAYNGVRDTESCAEEVINSLSSLP